nr:glycine-rich protein [Tanacetum cinerariifolium]
MTGLLLFKFLLTYQNPLKVGPGFVLRGPLENATNDAVMRTVIVPLMGTVSTSRMGRTGGVRRGHLLSNKIGSGGSYGGTAGYSCYNDTLNLPYDDAELPCQLGSGGGNDSTAAGGVLAIGSLEHPISNLSVDGSITANRGSSREGTSLVLKALWDIFEADEIYKICSVIGSPTEFTRCEGLKCGSKIRYQFPEKMTVVRSSRMKLDPQE